MTYLELIYAILVFFNYICVFASLYRGHLRPNSHCYVQRFQSRMRSLYDPVRITRTLPSYHASIRSGVKDQLPGSHWRREQRVCFDVDAGG